MPALRALLLLLLSLAAPLGAHQIDEITLHLRTDGGQVHATLEADAAYMLPEYRGDAELAPLDLAWLRSLNEEQRQRILQETRNYLHECLRLSSGDEVLPVTPSIPDFTTPNPAYLRKGLPEELPILDVLLESPLPANDLTLTWNEPFGVVLIVNFNDRIIPIVSGESVEVWRQQSAPPPTFFRWVQLGFHHILPAGLDHILFILGIFLLGSKWKALIGKSLLFTLAHSLTLALSALGFVSLPERPVEILIAASIAWIGIENLRLREAKRIDLWLIALFGLVHGLGFASQLAEFLPADQPHQLLPALAGFNLGVELGQLAILAAAFLLLGFWKSRFDLIRRLGGSLITLSGAIWVIERSFFQY